MSKKTSVVTSEKLAEKMIEKFASRYTALRSKRILNADERRELLRLRCAKVLIAK